METNLFKRNIYLVDIKGNLFGQCTSGIYSVINRFTICVTEDTKIQCLIQQSIKVKGVPLKHFS